MTSPLSTTTSELSLGRNMLNVARYYLSKRWVLLSLAGGFAVALGLYFGGWGWLVTVGAAPIILSTLPCLIMCGFGVCMACRSVKKDSATAAMDGATSPPALSVAKAPLAAGLSCCRGSGDENPATPSANNSANQQKEMSHA